MKRTSICAAGVMPLLLAACGAGQDASNLQSLGNHTPALVQSATATGVVSPEQQLDMRVALTGRDAASLDAYLTALYDPQSTAYAQYLTPDEFTALYGPDANQVEQVRTNLAAAGFDVEAEPHGMLLTAHANAAAAEAFFHTQLTTYEDSNGTTFFAPATDIAVARGVPITGVFGLHTSFPATSQAHRVMPPATATYRDKASGSGLTAAMIRKAYNVPSSANAAGQTVGIYELDGYLASDIALYASTNSINQPPLKNILVDNYSGGIQSTDQQSEVTLDIELVNALDPCATQLRIYEVQNNGQGGIDEWNEIANPTLGDKMLVSLISSSWGLAENLEGQSEAVNVEGPIFKQMAAQGQTAFVASGDSGYTADGKTASVSDPASQAWAVGVGGTMLKNTAGVYVSETAWASGGGGVSVFWPIPTWQKAAIAKDTQASSTFRNVPDVALDGDPNSSYVVYVNGQPNYFGGTSCAAPLWAAFFGDVNQARATNGLSPMGFAAPVLYNVAGGVNYSTNFHDVTTGNNGKFNAVTGYDNVTGLGSFNGANLLKTLSTGFGRSIFPAPTGFTPSN